jgi:hypothetical protein
MVSCLRHAIRTSSIATHYDCLLFYMDMQCYLSGTPHTNESSSVFSTNDKVTKFTFLISAYKLRNPISFSITEHTSKLFRPKLTETVKQYLH